MSDMGMYKRIAEILLAKDYTQQSLLPPMRVRSFAGDRGISISISDDDLETWDRLGILSPVVKLRRPFSYHRITEKLPDGSVRYDPQPLEGEPSHEEGVVKLYGPWDLPLDNSQIIQQGALIYPSSETFQPWSSLRDGYWATVDLLYHPYQIFRLHEVNRQSIWSIKLPNYSLSEGFENEMRGSISEILGRRLASLRQSEDSQLKILALLLLIEDRYLPDIRGWSTSYPSDILRPEITKNWYEWAETFDPNLVLQESGFTIEEIKQIRHDFAMQGHIVDPNSNWYLVIRYATYEWRGKLKNEVLLAWDYYEVVEMLRQFLTDLTGAYQPGVDDLVALGNSNWKKRVYGIAAEQIDFYRGNALPGLLRQFGLDPRIKVLFVVEGDSEMAFVERWCERKGIDLNYLAVRQVTLDGVSGLKNRRVRQYLHDALADGACTILAVDEEQDAAEVLQQLVQENLIERVFDVADLRRQDRLAIGAILWKPCFEDANFTFDELLEAWLNVIDASQSDPMVDGERLRQEVRERYDSRGKSAIKSIEEVAAHSHPHLPFSKKAIARSLADRFADFNRPIVLLLQNVAQLALSARTARYEPPQSARDS